jgi:hypothetical protein
MSLKCITAQQHLSQLRLQSATKPLSWAELRPVEESVPNTTRYTLSQTTTPGMACHVQ